MNTLNHTDKQQVEFQEKNGIGIVEYKDNFSTLLPSGILVEVRSPTQRVWSSLTEWMTDIDTTLEYKGSHVWIGNLIEMRRGDVRKGDFPPDKPSRVWTSLAEWQTTINEEVNSPDTAVQKAGFFLIYKGSKVMAKELTERGSDRKWTYLQDWIDAQDKAEVTKDPTTIVKTTRYCLGTSSTVGITGGLLLELRRGEQTWPSFKADQKTWASFKDWRVAVGDFTSEILVDEKTKATEATDAKMTPKERREQRLLHNLTSMHPDLKRLIPSLDQQRSIKWSGNLVKTKSIDAQIRSKEKTRDHYLKHLKRNFDRKEFGITRAEFVHRSKTIHDRFDEDVARIRSQPTTKFHPNPYRTASEFMFVNSDGNLAYIWYNISAGVFATGTNPEYPMTVTEVGRSLAEIGVGTATKIWAKYHRDERLMLV